ncbi:MAG: DUF4145 domain-containing protein [Comamonadaceae bacterium]|nr:MAG: DUF4145 domain-containing protein [Comamonadaceae bacterium]
MTDALPASEPSKVRKGHCPECDGERSCDILGHLYAPWDWSDRYGNSVHGGVDHSLLRCRGCETVFYQKSSWNSEDYDEWYGPDGEAEGEPSKTITTYPKPESKTKPPWIASIAQKDDQLGSILDEVYLAYDSNLNILTAVGLRTALDRATEVLNIDPAISFEEKLIELRAGGWIGETEKEVLEVVVNAGSAAAHRAWKPSRTELSQLLSVMEIFLQKAFIVEKKALSITAKLPAKPKRQKRPAPKSAPSAKP